MVILINAYHGLHCIDSRFAIESADRASKTELFFQYSLIAEISKIIIPSGNLQCMLHRLRNQRDD